MKILTLTQPWASMITFGAKFIETRSWSTPYRGLLAIHAAASLEPVGGKRGLVDISLREPFATVMREQGYDNPLCLPRYAIIAVCDLVDCRRIAADIREWGAYTHEGVPVIWPLTDTERAFGDYSPGRYAWLLDEVRPLREPFLYRGAQGLRDLDDATAHEVMRRAAV